MISWECNCGWVNSASDPVCPNCSALRQRGTPLGPPSAPRIDPPPGPARPSSSPAPIVIVLVAVIGIFLALGVAGALVAAARHAPGN